MIELQGDLVKKSESWDNQKLGDLEVRDGTPFLTIGIHELEGEFVTLKKPFVVLDPQQEEDETVTTCRGVECRSKFTVAGVIRRKVLFKLRPRVLVDAPLLAKTREPVEGRIVVVYEDLAHCGPCYGFQVASGGFLVLLLRG